MQKITWTALTLALTLPAFAAPAKPTTTSTRKPTTTVKPSTNNTAKANNTATKPIPTITPDGTAAVAAVKTTLLPDISPVARGYQVVINVPQQRLFLYNNGVIEKVYPVAVGKAITQTTLGEHKIGVKAFNPTWHIPKSIQAERKDGVKTVPPGPDNPLGPVFVRLGDPKLGLGIHGTNAPSSVPGVRSHGCVRMKSEQALDFANTITTGSPAVVSYEMAALNVDSNNQLWLAAYKDPYSKKTLNTNALKQSIKAWGTANKVTIADSVINQVLRAKTGTPVCLSCKGKGKFRIQGDLQSLAWNSGSASLTLAKGGRAIPVPVKDEVLEDGAEIEIDAGSDAVSTKKGATSKTVTTPAKSTTSTTVSKPATSTKKASKPAVKSTSAFDDHVEETPVVTEEKPIKAKKSNSTTPSTTETLKEVPLHPMQPIELKPTNALEKSVSSAKKDVKTVAQNSVKTTKQAVTTATKKVAE